MNPSRKKEIESAFFEEAKEHLEILEKTLIRIESFPEDIDIELVNEIFRAIHTIKGSSGFLGLVSIKSLSHAMENVIGKIRKKNLFPTPALISLLLEATDTLSKMVDQIDESDNFNIKILTKKLDQFENPLSQQQFSELKYRNKSSLEARLPDGDKVFDVSGELIEKAQRESFFIYMIEYDVEKDIFGIGKDTSQVLEELKQNGTVIIETKSLRIEKNEETTKSASGNYHLFVLAINPVEPQLLKAILNISSDRIHVIFNPDIIETPPVTNDLKPERDIIPLDEIASMITKHQETGIQPLFASEMALHSKKCELPKQVSPASKDTIRVNLKALDTLMTLAGELVLARNQLMQNINAWDKKRIETSFQRLNLITSEIQESIMATRMQPINNVFSKLHRLVRDSAKELGKDIELLFEGEEVELDKTVIEAISDPLTHLVRNSVDHGIEAPETRMKLGKPQKGTISLKASHEAGQVKIVISDDGAGINLGKIKQIALANGLISGTQLGEMHDKEIMELIFLPGFTTKDHISDISGRGVGMDVVASNLSRIGGSIDIISEEGKNTTFEIKLPLTLAIIPSLLVSVKNEHFAIPQVNIIELVRISSDKADEQIQKIGSAVVLRLRGELIPLVSLKDVLGIVEENPESKNHIPEIKSCSIVIVIVGELKYGIAVDRFLESEEIVVKPLGRHLRDCKAYAGSTIEGNGKVSLILDVLGISKLMNLADVKEMAERSIVKQKTESKKNLLSFLIVKTHSSEQFAIPLEIVSKILRINRNRIETAAGKEIIRLDDKNLLLFSIEDFVPVAAKNGNKSPYIIVISIEGKDIGFKISEIIDIVDIGKISDDTTFKSSAIAGSFTLFERVTLILDFSWIFSGISSKNQKQETTSSEILETPEVLPLILIAEDSDFFLKKIDEIIKEEGWSTLLAKDGLEALDLLEKNKIDILVTDIEMPNMDGLNLTRKIRLMPQFSKLPILALTSIAGETAEQEGLKAGINEYIIKLDKTLFLEKLHHYVKKISSQAKAGII